MLCAKVNMYRGALCSVEPAFRETDPMLSGSATRSRFNSGSAPMRECELGSSRRSTFAKGIFGTSITFYNVLIPRYSHTWHCRVRRVGPKFLGPISRYIVT